MFDHVSLKVKDLARSRAFYEKALAPLGLSMMSSDDGSAGFGDGKVIGFWIGTGGPPVTGLHVAFGARDRTMVDAFHSAALAAGGKDNGKPGIRADYSPTYYGAFAFDPDGNNIEAVCHKG